MPNRYQALFQQKADLLAKAKAFSDKDELTAAEDSEYNALIEQITALNPAIERERVFMEEARAMGSAPSADQEAAAPPDPATAAASPTPFMATNWRGAWGKQLQAVVQAGRTPHQTPNELIQLQAASGASEQMASDGGFVVQFDIAEQLLMLVHETGVLAKETDSTPISANANSLRINVIDETSRVDGSRWGGVQAFWTAEAGSLTGSKPKYRQMELNLQKLTGLYYATDELLMDAAALGDVIAKAFAEEFGFKIDDAIIRGTGSGMPLGILGAAGTLDIAKTTGQAAKTVSLENIQAMYARMWAPSIGNAKWFINQDVWPQLFQLSQVVGVGGAPVFLPPGGVSVAPYGTLMGRPIQPIEQCATLGTSGDIIFADLSQYKMIEKQGIQAASSIHVQFLTDETTFRFVLRTDGQPKRNVVLTPFKGANTLSPILTLATRA